jgi:metal-dependent HD superfamily phosphatase/phosphodiesterase
MADEVTLETIKCCAPVPSYIQHADAFIEALGYTEHGERHASLVSNIAKNIMCHLNFTPRQAELAAIAGYLHDIGNMISREDHGISGALLAKSMLEQLGMPFDEIAIIVNAIGSHEEEQGDVCSPVAAAVILADKSDVHRTRVRNPDQLDFDIHDRVNYAATRSFLRVDEKLGLISLEIEIDTTISRVMEYFEIFLSRMVMCRKAAEFLDCKFGLVINKTQLL